MFETRMTILSVALALAACGGGGTEAAETDASSSSSSTTAPATTTDTMPCTPGQEGCECEAGACDAGLECFSNVCVMPPAPESTGHVETTTPVDPSTSESSTSSDESTSDESSSDDGESSTTAPALPCLEGNNTCQDGELETCVDGQRELMSCADACAPMGYDSPGCHDVNTCECAGLIDDYCNDVATAGCECYASLDFGYECTPDAITDWYDWCWDDDDSTHDFAICMGEGLLADPNACDEVVNVCYSLL